MQFDAPEFSSGPLRELQAYLEAVPAGAVENVGDLTVRLARCWHGIRGSREEGMRAEKLFRAEDVRWNPPVLTFRLERHGGTVLGSTRAEVHHWTVDVFKGEACCEVSGFRQIRARDKPLRVEPLVAEAVEKIVGGVADPMLEWTAPGSEVRVLVSTFITGQNSQTEQGRRKRFRGKLREALERVGWVAAPGKRDVFRR